MAGGKGHHLPLRVDTEAGIAVMWMNRPEAHNALDEAMVKELVAALKKIDASRSLHVMVLAAEGPAFCVGALDWRARAHASAAVEKRLDELLDTLSCMTKVTVARVHGAAIAEGMALAVGCDIAVAAHEAEFGRPELRLGLSPRWPELSRPRESSVSPKPFTRRAINAMRRHAAHRYMLTGERFSASEAYRLGLVQELAPMAELDATVNQILGHLVQGPPKAFEMARQVIFDHRE